MGIITKEVEVRLWGNTVEYYNDFGYVGKHGDIIVVKVEDLSNCSTVFVKVKCDYCGKEKDIKYVNYNTHTKNGEYCCSSCASLKHQETMLKKYGYKSPIQVPEIKQRLQQTNLERYGYISPSKNKDVKEKIEKTNLEKYGVKFVLQSKEVQSKIKQTNIEKYGVENILSNNDIKEKIKQTNLEKYGVENVSQNKDIQNKRIQTFIERFGVTNPLKNKECVAKLKQTNMQKYKVESIFQLEEIKQKVKQTNMAKYGVENVMQSPEILEKWFAKNGSNFVKSSRQQQYICNLYNGILNYPFKCFALDIYLLEDNLDIEYDGSGHKMSIYFGNVTEEEFEMKELYRNTALKREGYKQMRIISTKDLLPNDIILLQMLEQTRQYFSKYPQHSWIEFNIDTSSIRNAEYKDGISYNFGELRTIKDSDLNTKEATLEVA